MKKVLMWALLLFPLLNQRLFACAVCFGGGDSNLSRGFFWGVLFLGALPFVMLAFFVRYIVSHTRKHNHDQHLIAK